MKLCQFDGNRLCIVLHSETHIRNYISTGALEKITAKNKCLFLVEESIKIPDEFEASHNVFKFSMSSTTEYYDLLELVMFILRKKSQTFDFRIRRLYFPNLSKKPNDFWNIHSKLYFYLKKLKRLLRWAFFTILSLPALRALVSKYLKKG